MNFLSSRVFGVGSNSPDALDASRNEIGLEESQDSGLGGEWVV